MYMQEKFIGNLYIGKLFKYIDDTSKIKTYVGTDGLIHFTNKDGADSVLNFNKGKEYKNIKIVDTITNKNTKNVSLSTEIYGNKFITFIELMTYSSQWTYTVSTTGSIQLQYNNKQ